jgi:hypothetical protein
MKEESTEPNGNDNYIKHRIVSWYGEHKMLTRLLILGILILGLSGGYWYLFDEGCNSLNLSVEWVPIEGYKIDEGDEPTVHCYENQELELIIKVTSTETGFLTVTANREYMKDVELTKEKDNWSWLTGDKVTVIEAYIGQNLTEFPFHIWAKARKDPDEYESGITVRASLNGCEKMAKVHIKILEGEPTVTPETPTPPSDTPPPTTSPPICLGTSLLTAMFICGVLTNSLKKKR